MEYIKGDKVFCNAIVYLFGNVEPQCGTIIFKCPDWINWLLSMYIVHTDDSPIFYYIKCQDGINRFNNECSLQPIEVALQTFKFCLTNPLMSTNDAKLDFKADLRINHWVNLIESYKKT